MRVTALVCSALLLVPAPVAARDTKAWGRVSDVGRDVLVAVALGLPIVDGDREGAVQGAGSIGAAFLLSEGLKLSVGPHRRRLRGRGDVAESRRLEGRPAGTGGGGAGRLLARRGAQASLV
jgi:hypothetical protein